MLKYVNKILLSYSAPSAPLFGLLLGQHLEFIGLSIHVDRNICPYIGLDADFLW